jgi:hypothetical protein
MMDGIKFKGTVAAFADYVQYSSTLWYRGFYNTVYSRAISTNRRRGHSVAVVEVLSVVVQISFAILLSRNYR